MNNKYFYITTTLPYVNADPHIGFALEIVQADVVARWHRKMGESVVFNFGTDEHGLKIYRKAVEQGKSPQTYCNEYASRFSALKDALNLSYTNFVRTTDIHHIKAAREFWKRCVENGDIYKKNYKIKYCVGCELEKTESELVDNKCPWHPDKDLETIDEENYFFRFSKYKTAILELYKKRDDFVVPEGKFNEIKTFVGGGLEDFSVSRLKSKLPWGIEVPGDPDQVMYVWFDALINYISTLGWPEEMESFEKYWPGVQVAGKDNLRQQSAMWQAMLMSAGLPNSRQVFIHGFLTADGQKISKSLGNTVDPVQVANKYGTDALRYFLLAKIHPWEDSDFSMQKLENTYNSDLANGLGNTISRVAKLAEKSGKNFGATKEDKAKVNLQMAILLGQYRFHEAIGLIWDKNAVLEAKIETEKPWGKSGSELETLLTFYISTIREIAYLLGPFLPNTAEKIEAIFSGPKIGATPPIFPRIATQND